MLSGRTHISREPPEETLALSFILYIFCKLFRCHNLRTSSLAPWTIIICTAQLTFHRAVLSPPFFRLMNFSWKRKGRRNRGSERHGIYVNILFSARVFVRKRVCSRISTAFQRTSVPGKCLQPTAPENEHRASWTARPENWERRTENGERTTKCVVLLAVFFGQNPKFNLLFYAFVWKEQKVEVLFEGFACEEKVLCGNKVLELQMNEGWLMGI